jgi:hypothetical protein
VIHLSHGDKILSNFPPEALEREQTHGASYTSKFVAVTLLNNSYITPGRAQAKYSSFQMKSDIEG